MDFATCEKCSRVLHESLWIHSGDSIYCPACRMPSTNLYAKKMVLSPLVKKAAASVTSLEELADRRLS
jgi:hypothetical protein